MKHVLIIDESALFRDYLKERLQEFDVKVTTAVNGLDGIAKLHATPPDLIVIDYHLSRKTCKEVLEEKKKDPNTVNVPVIITATRLDKNRILELMPFGIKKVFSKPIRMDAFYQTCSEILGIKFEFDDTPCILEAHVNDNIVFVEIARGLNREKIDLLKFKLAELVDLYEIKTPRLLVMLSDMTMSFADGPNVEKLLEVVTANSKSKMRHIKFLTNDSFIAEFVRGHKVYSGIEVVNNLQKALDGLLEDTAQDESGEPGKIDLVSKKILSADAAPQKAESIQTKFDAETAKVFSVDRAEDVGKGLSIAVVDDDFVLQQILVTTFTQLGAKVTAFSDGREVLDALRSRTFDLMFLDILMPNVNGFDVLKSLKSQDLDIPVIVLSAVSQREAVIRAFQAGVKSYLIKPLKPEQIIRKTAEILKTNF